MNMGVSFTSGKTLNTLEETIKEKLTERVCIIFVLNVGQQIK